MIATIRLEKPSDLALLQKRITDAGNSSNISISICAGTGCRANGSMELFDEFRSQLDQEGLADIQVRATGCHGFCEKGPLVGIFPDHIF